MSIQNINLGSLDSSADITFLGEQDTTSGESVSGIGDINKDGYDDILIGAPRCNSGTTYTTCVTSSDFGGISYVIFGNKTQYLTNINLASLEPWQGFSIFGNGTSASGYSVGWTGDVNQDGFADFIIGAPGENSLAGASYVIFGNTTSSFSSNIYLSNLKQTQGFSIYGANIGDYSGYSVRGAGDVNNDGFADVVIGAINANSKAGITYIIFGNRTEYLNNIYLNNLSIFQGISIYGANKGDQSGWSAGSAGDFNQDGISDIIIGAPSALDHTGNSYVIFGNKTLTDIYLTNITNFGFTITGANANDYSGLSVSTAEDFNNDGIADVIIGAPATDLDSGSSYIVFGNKHPGDLNLAENANGRWITITSSSAVDYAGTEVNFAGDINKDGISDVVIGAPGAGDGGTCYVVFGSNNPSDLSLATLNSDVVYNSPGFFIAGANYGDKLGFSVSGAGDFNGDSFDDVALGALGVGYYDNGASYVIYGSNMPEKPSHNWWTETPGGIAATTVLSIYGGALIFGNIYKYSYDYDNMPSFADNKLLCVFNFFAINPISWLFCDFLAGGIQRGVNLASGLAHLGERVNFIRDLQNQLGGRVNHLGEDVGFLEQFREKADNLLTEHNQKLIAQGKGIVHHTSNIDHIFEILGKVDTVD
ncbi:MAG: hypothetical protein WBJ81_00285 [Rickettsiales bacterium]